MKRIIIFSLLLISLQTFSQTVLTSCDYDGVYIEISTGKYVQLNETTAFYGRYIPGCSTYNAGSELRLPEVVFADNNNVVTVPTIKKIILKGADFTDAKIASVTVHPAEIISKYCITTARVFKNATEPNWTNTKFYTYERANENFTGYKTSVIKRTKKDSYSYEFTFGEDVVANKAYMIWLDKKLWIFQTQTALKYTTTKTAVATLPEYDGLFIKQKDSKYLELDTTGYYTGKCFEYDRIDSYGQYYKSGTNIYPFWSPEKYRVFYFASNFNLTKNAISLTNLDAIIVKGNFDVTAIKLYALKSVTIAAGKAFFATSDATQQIKTGTYYYIDENSTAIEILRQTLTGGIFQIKPKTTLTAGNYVIYIGSMCWQLIVT